MRRVWKSTLNWVCGLAMASSSGMSAFAQQPSCGRADFEAVVASASDALRAITQKNSPSFQAKLRALKEKRGWTHDQFMAEGPRFVRDDQIVAFDEKTSALLARINAAGENSASGAADCATLSELRGNMAALVDIQNSKWSYMFGNIDAELAR